MDYSVPHPKDCGFSCSADKSTVYIINNHLSEELILKELTFSIINTYNKYRLLFIAYLIKSDGLLSTKHIVKGTVKYGPKYKESIAKAILHNIKNNKGTPILKRKGTWV